MKRCLSIFCLLVFLLVSCQPTSSDITDMENETLDGTDTVESTEITDDTTNPTEDIAPEQSILPLKVPIIDKEPYTAWIYSWTLIPDLPDLSEYQVDYHSIFSKVFSFAAIDSFQHEDLLQHEDIIQYEVDGKVYTCEYRGLVQGDPDEYRMSPYIVYVWFPYYIPES